MVDAQVDDEVEQAETEDEKENKEEGTKPDDKKAASSSSSRRQGSRPQQRSQRYSRGGRNYRRSYRSRRKVCAFCVENVKTIDWKDVDRLRRFVNDGGGMRSRRKTGTCAKHQRRLAVAIKRARHMALLSYTIEHVRVMGKA
jgi:small subunit ribosomal protein S18